MKAQHRAFKEEMDVPMINAFHKSHAKRQENVLEIRGPPVDVTLFSFKSPTGDMSLKDFGYNKPRFDEAYLAQIGCKPYDRSMHEEAKKWRSISKAVRPSSHKKPGT